jgi:hypothetical protein
MVDNTSGNNTLASSGSTLTPKSTPQDAAAEIGAARNARAVDVVGSLTTKNANANRDPAARYRLTNRGGHSATVPLVHVTTGQRTEVFVQPGGQPKIPPGYRVDPVYAARNQHIGAAPVTGS